jgi:GT2 family glycosyltransferase
MKCDIIIPVWDQLENTRDCIENLIKNTHFPYKLILIDNASDKETRAYLESLKTRGSLEVEVIRNERNAGFVTAVNQALKISNAPFVCIMNNDTVPAPGWLERMVDFAQGHKDVGLVNPVCNGHGATPIEVYAKGLEREEGSYMEMNQCQGFCMLIKREVISKVGYLDESFGIGGYDDTDYSMRAYLAGYRCVAIRDAYVYHRLHGSFDHAGNRAEWVKRNQRIYYEKWGKHLRVGVALSFGKLDREAMSRVAMFAYGLAREWSWVYLWVRSGGDKTMIRRAFEDALAEKELPPHQNIKIDCFNLPTPLFDLVIAGKLCERMRRRMRDKRFDAMVVCDALPLKVAPLFARLTKVRVIGISTREKAANWIHRGKEIALFIRQKMKDVGRGKAASGTAQTASL